jgi:GNAT superfamily N-acetyltransferase
MQIKKITANKDQFMDLLLLGDESEEMIWKYLDRGELFALYDDDLKTVAVVTKEDENTCEIKNMATYEACQGKGYGSAMMKYIIDYCKNKCHVLLVGTGDVDRILTYYQQFGFVYSHKIENFFIDNYDHEMIEDGKPLKDMVYLKINYPKIAIKQEQIALKPLEDEDVSLFEKWLDKDYIYKWLCPDGATNKADWLNEINERNGNYNFLKHFVAYYNGKKIGYGLYADCFFLKDLEEEGHDFKGLYGDVVGKNHTFEIGYLVGEEEYLNRGVGKIIVQLLEEEIIKIGGKEIAADPSEENTISIKTLLSNGFEKIRDGEYRKFVQIK